jgi:N utilization substance protein B
VARRREARRLAIAILYQADVLGRPPLEVLEERRAIGQKVPRFADELVRGVAERRDDIDAVIGRSAEGWTVDRMPPIDRTVLRVATLEVLDRDDVPVATAIDEAVSAAKALSTEDSGRFVNGVLGRIAREARGTREAPAG